MAHDVFISYSHKDKSVADAVCANLEANGIRCWYAPRDIAPGQNWAAAIIDAIRAAKVFVLLFSEHSNASGQVSNELSNAFSAGCTIVPFSLTELKPSPSMQYYLSSVHWMDAITPPLTDNISRLYTYVCEILQREDRSFQPVPEPRPKKHIALICVLAFVVLAAAGFFIYRHVNGYPRTSAERVQTEQVLYYLETNLTYCNTIADRYEDGLSACRRYLLTGAADGDELNDALAVDIAALEKLDISLGTPKDGFITSLGGSPFDIQALLGVYDWVVLSQSEAISNLNFLQGLMQGSSYLSASQKLAYLELYEDLETEDVKTIAEVANAILIPVKDSALEDFWFDFLPGMDHIPLSYATWVKNENDLSVAYLDAETEQSLDSADNIVSRFEEVVQQEADALAREKQAAENEEDAEDTSDAQKGFILSLLFNEEADDLEARILRAEEMGRDTTELRELCTACGIVSHLRYSLSHSDEAILELQDLDTQDPSDLWYGMMILFGRHMEEEALSWLADYRAMLAEDTPSVKIYCDSVQALIENVENTGIRHGVVVTGYDPNNEEQNPVLRIGDIIIAFNGRDCHLFDEYVEWKNALEGDTYTVTVLRPSDTGELEELELELTTDMPLVALSTVSRSLQYEYEGLIQSVISELNKSLVQHIDTDYGDLR